jgi:hypothetical protein
MTVLLCGVFLEAYATTYCRNQLAFSQAWKEDPQKTQVAGSWRPIGFFLRVCFLMIPGVLLIQAAKKLRTVEKLVSPIFLIVRSLSPAGVYE